MRNRTKSEMVDESVLSAIAGKPETYGKLKFLPLFSLYFPTKASDSGYTHAAFCS